MGETWLEAAKGVSSRAGKGFAGCRQPEFYRQRQLAKAGVKEKESGKSITFYLNLCSPALKLRNPILPK